MDSTSGGVTTGFPGSPVSIALAWSDDEYVFRAGLPISEPPARPPGENEPVQIGETYAGPVVKAVHVGRYSGRAETYSKLEAYIAAHALEPVAHPWDEHVDDSDETPEEQLVTNVYWPVGHRP